MSHSRTKHSTDVISDKVEGHCVKGGDLGHPVIVWRGVVVHGVGWSCIQTIPSVVGLGWLKVAPTGLTTIWYPHRSQDGVNK